MTIGVYGFCLDSPFWRGTCRDPATVLTVVGTAVSAFGAIQSGRQAASTAKVQSAVIQQQADRERQDMDARERDFRRNQLALFASRRAILGGTNVEPGDGSPLLVSEDFARESELQALRIRSGGEVQATRLEQEAALTRARGRQERTAGYYRGGSLLLSGAGTAFGRSSPSSGRPSWGGQR